MRSRVSRRSLLLLATFAVVTASVTASLGSVTQARRTQFLLTDVRVGDGGRPFAGDSSRLATISPNGDRLRDAAIVHFRLVEPGRVTLGAFASGEGAAAPRLLAQSSGSFGAGMHELSWRPPRTTAPRTYMLRLVGRSRSGARTTIGSLKPGDPSSHVVRVLGIDAGFTRPSYSPGTSARLTVSTDEPSVAIQLFRQGRSRR